MDGFDAMHILWGRNLIRIGGVQDLKDTPELWKNVWLQSQSELLPEYVAKYPGRRPQVWWKFLPDGFPELTEDESECEYLHKAGLLSAEEIEGIKAKALSLIEHNRGRDPNDWRSNFIGDMYGYVEFCVKHGLLSEQEAPDHF